ncbi:MAG: hypothetical protein SFZ02_07990 [bacterium]|nr:hypothetical protein [bacterium]
MTTIEQEILTLIGQMDENQQHQLLDTARQLIQKPHRYYTAVELLELPEEERERYMAWSFAQAENEEFEIFEAYSEEDSDDDAVYLCQTDQQIRHSSK